MMETYSGRIVIAEDEDNIRAGLRDVLGKDGHVVTDVGSGEEALAALATNPFDTAIVDIRMPGMSGIELLQSIRAGWGHVAVIILTGHGDLDSAMAAVKAGAHDYLLKPAQPETIRRTVLEAVKMSRRRKKQTQLIEAMRSGLAGMDDPPDDAANDSTASAGRRPLVIGDLYLDLRAHELFQSGRAIHLSPTEFKLLAVLASQPNEVVDYPTLARLSLGYDTTLWEAKELIKRHVSAIRRKIEPDPVSPHYILNVRGVGYRLAASDPDHLANVVPD
jgi:DNA-binding response OmpR family regulator